MGKIMERLYRRLLTLDPHSRQYLMGAGMMLNFMPPKVGQTFQTSDAEALRSDWDKIAKDFWWAVEKAEDEKHTAAGR